MQDITARGKPPAAAGTGAQPARGAVAPDPARGGGGRLVSKTDLLFDAGRLMFCMPEEGGKRQIHEIEIDGSGSRRPRGDMWPSIPLGDAPGSDSRVAGGGGRNAFCLGIGNFGEPRRRPDVLCN